MSNKILAGVIALLVLAAGYFGWQNWQESRARDDAILVVVVDGQPVGEVGLGDLRALGGEEFSVVLRSSGKEPQENAYTGIALSRVLEEVKPGILDGRELVSVTALDGYAVAYSAEEIRQPEHIYLVWAKDGAPLAGKAQGGSGPLLVIARQDEFGQRWCKFAVQVEVR